MAKEKLLVIPLGGLGEIGKNMTVFQYGNDIIVLDAGLSFPDDDMFGIDLVIPDMFRDILSKRYEQPFWIVIAFLLAIIAVYNWVVALLALILLGGIYLITRKTIRERNQEINQLLDAISKSVDQASNYAVQNLPIGIAIIDPQSSLCWANSVFRDWIGDFDDKQRLESVMAVSCSSMKSAKWTQHCSINC